MSRLNLSDVYKRQPVSSLITTLLGELAAIERQGISDRLNSGRELYIQKGGRLGRKPGSRKTAEQRKEEYREAIISS